MTNHAQRERHQLADLFIEVGPDAPTLCGGWTTADLAAHLVTRETRPDAAAGIAIPPLATYGDRVQRGIRDAHRWPALVERVRSGPPLVMRLLDQPVNTVEYFVHHEDVRRAVDGWEPRALPADEEAALWGRLRLVGRALFRKAPVGVAVASPGHGRMTLKGKGDVTVSGPPGELVLFGFGRQDHAGVELIGPDEAIEQLKGASLGL